MTGETEWVPVSVLDAAEAQALTRPETVRARCGQVFAAVAEGSDGHFRINFDRLPTVADYIAETIRLRYPEGKIPLHGRLAHLDAGGVARVAAFLAPVGEDPLERLRSLVELIAVSVLLDAGAGAAWSYVDRAGQRYARSEGLAVASVELVASGICSDDPRRPWRVASGNLLMLDAGRLGQALQVTPENPIEGLEGRLALLRALGSGCVDRGRIGRIADPWFEAGRVEAGDILQALVERLGPLWPGGFKYDGAVLGDVWPHPAAGLVPFHKLLQWLTWSLIDPLRHCGVAVAGVEALTGLPEYRNGGLLLDLGALVPHDAELACRTLTPADPAVIEWRALTVVLLDRLRLPVAERLGCDNMSLGQLLEGGSWAAGRRLAAALRPGAAPPLQVCGGGALF